MQKNLIIAAATMLVFTACSSTGVLQAKNPDQKISGTVTRGFIEPHQVEVTLDGKTYRGEWRVGVPTAEQKLNASLPHNYHIGQVRSALVATDGSKMECRWETHGQTGEGSCKVDNHEFPLILK